MMRLPGTRGAVTAFRWVRSRPSGGALILGYHRLRRGADDLFDLAVARDDLIGHLDAIRKCARPTTITDLARGIEAHRLPRRAVAITFDDGYDDLIDDVLPLLEHADMRATVFVTTGFLGRPFWWDELAAVLLAPHRLPPRLKLTLRTATYEWKLAPDRADYSAPQAPERCAALLSITSALERLPVQDRIHLVDHVRECLGPRVVPRRSHRSMTAAELQRLAASPLIEIGAHSISHPRLGTLREFQQWNEIEGSRRQLEEIIGKPVKVFSYPHGSYGAETVATVSKAGFTGACCSRPDVTTAWSHRFAMPRFWMHRLNAGGFERWLNRWLPN